jgi:hypothetical protein
MNPYIAQSFPYAKKKIPASKEDALDAHSL